jgi:sulfotransferase family protein
MSDERDAGATADDDARGAGARLPTFLVVGAMKAGTTSLYHYLRSHPQIFMPDEKEVMFFDARHRWDLGVEWYARQFAPAPAGALALGEASTSYTKFPVVQGVPERIASVLPEVRLIYVLRHPVERMRSHYLYLLSRGKERRPIERAFAEDPAYLDTSRYAMQIEQYLPHMPLERFLFVDSRDLAHDRAATLRTIHRFLGVDEEWTSPLVDREFFRSSERRMKPGLTQRLRGVPGVAALTRRVPAPVRTLARRLPAEPVDVEMARIDDDLRRHLEVTLAEDVRRLRAYLPPGFDGWGLA